MTERKRKRVEEDRMQEEIYKGKEEEEGERRGEEESSNRSNPRRDNRARPVSCLGNSPGSLRQPGLNAKTTRDWGGTSPDRAARCSPAALDHFGLGGETVPR